MYTTDPVADMLTRIRNAVAVRQNFVLVPASRLKWSIAQVLRDEGYVGRCELTRDKGFGMIKIFLKYTEDRKPVLNGLRRISKPGRRVYTGKEEIPWVQSGLGTVILSTPKGVLAGKQARRLGVGGEILAEIW
ncbi:MAG: 30S ribosomal protein S8 [Anaerolineae bacterium]